MGASANDPGPQSGDGKRLLALMQSARDAGAWRDDDYDNGTFTHASLYGIAVGMVIVGHFSAEADLEAITDFTRNARLQVGDESLLPPRETEAVIRGSLWGDTHLLVHTVPDTIARIQYVLLLHLVKHFSLTDEELARIARAAETTTMSIASDVGDDGKQVAWVGVPGFGHTTERCASNQRAWTTLSSGNRRTPSTGGPSTMYGRYVRAIAVGDADDQERLLNAIQATNERDFHIGATAVHHVAVRRRFRNCSSHEIACFVKRMCEFYSCDGDKFWPLEAEILVRNALGHSVSLEGMDVPESQLQLLTAVSIAFDLRLSPEDLDELLVEAEQFARSYGYPLSPD